MIRILIVLGFLGLSTGSQNIEDKEHIPNAAMTNTATATITATATKTSTMTPTSVGAITQAPNQTPIPPQKFFIKKTGLSETGFGMFTITLSDSDALSKMNLVIEYPKEIEVKDLVMAPGNKCTVTTQAGGGTLTISQTCNPPISGDSEIAQWTAPQSVQSEDFRVITCTANDRVDSCLISQ